MQVRKKLQLIPTFVVQKMASSRDILDVLSLALFYGFDKETEHAFIELDLTKRSFQEFDLTGYFTMGRQYLYLYNTRDPRDPNVPNDSESENNLKALLENNLKALLTRLFEKGLQYVFVLRDNKCFLFDLNVLR